MEKQTARDYLAIYDILLPEVTRVLEWTWDDDKEVYHNASGEEVEWEDFESVSIDVVAPEGHIDAIEMWGDGTIEFHEIEAQESFNWADYPIEVLKEIINKLIGKIK